MNLYKISQDENNDYDTYWGAVVVAPDEETARNMNPCTGLPIREWNVEFSDWCSSPAKVFVQLLGKAKAGKGSRPGVILSSYRAG